MKRKQAMLWGIGLSGCLALGLALVLVLVLVVAIGGVDGAGASQSKTLDLAAGPRPSATHRIQVEGRLEGEGVATIVLRLDDQSSRDYATRANLERVFPVGPFRWQLPLGGIADMRGRVLDLERLRLILAFKAAGTARVHVDRLALVEATALPPGSRGFAFGAHDAPLPEGFERIAPGDARIVVGAAVAVRRPMPDPLVANGVRGVARVRIPWPRGRAGVTLWTEDPGAWELLPHPLSRRILVNGQTLLKEDLTADAWIRQRYLRNRDVEHAAGSDAWSAFGRLRGEAHTAMVEVGEEGVTIELASDEPGGAFLSAVLIAPAGDDAALASVQARRAAWYRDTWPVLASDIQSDDADVHRVAIGERQAQTRDVEMRVAPGTGERLRLRISGIGPETAAQLRVEFDSLDTGQVTALIWAARERLERRRAQDSFLTRTDHILDGERRQGPAPGTDRRLYEHWVQVGAATPSGRHRGRVVIENDGREVAIPLLLEVLPVALPDVRAPAGPYLDESPHFSWFSHLSGYRMRQLDCDADFVARLGLAGAAPAIAAPHLGGGLAFRTDLRRAGDSGLAMPVLAYAAAKRTLQAVGAERGADILADALRMASAAGLEAPVWSIADEPSNPAAQQPWQDWLVAIRARSASGVRIAGHLNARSDRALVSKFDVVLINGGFGLDLEVIAAARAAGPQVWLYNIESPRLAAGAWLWRSAAERYVQWHARMPTADPFDPLDGREGDEQLILPSDAACPAVPSIHRDLLDLADGVVDQRWLLWLDGQPTTAARDLKAQLLGRLGERWAKAAKLERADLRAMRESIIELALATQDSQQ